MDIRNWYLFQQGTILCGDVPLARSEGSIWTYKEIKKWDPASKMVTTRDGAEYHLDTDTKDSYFAGRNFADMLKKYIDTPIPKEV